MSKKNGGDNIARPGKLNRRQSQSAECLMSLVNGNAERKASTPTLDRTAQSESPDISCIDKLVNQSYNKDSSQSKPNKKSNRETVKDPELEKKLELSYIYGIQAAFKCELEKRRASEVENNLQTLQERLSKCQVIVEKSKRRLKNINLNKEVALLHSLHYPNYAKVLENLNSKGLNCEELEELLQKLEDDQNMLQLKNITVPTSGGDQLCSLMADTAEDFKKLQANSEFVETQKLLKEVSDVNTATKNTLESCTMTVSQAESLVLQKRTVESNLHYLQLD